MSNYLRKSDDPTSETDSPFRRRRIWLATGVAGLTGVVGLAGVAYATPGANGAHRLAEVNSSTAQLANDYDKDDDKDKDDDVRKVDCDDDDLIEALDRANRNDGGTLKLAKDCTYELNEFDKKSEAGLPTIKERIKIDGNGATIEREGRDGFRIFRVADGGDLTLKDLAVKNGSADGDRKDDKDRKDRKDRNDHKDRKDRNDYNDRDRKDRNDYNDRDDRDRKDRNDRDRKDRDDRKDRKEHKGDGGGLLVERGGRAQLKDTKFFLNSAEENGGAIANFGRLEVKSSTLENNHAGDDGGAIFNAGILKVEGSHDDKGGESRITNNTAGKNGGGVANGHGEKKDEKKDKKKDGRDRFDDRYDDRYDDDRRAGTVEIEKTFIEDNSAKKNGGGLFSNDGFVDVHWSFIKSNTAGKNGGGIAAIDTVLTVKKSIIEKNKAHKDGGGIYNVSSDKKKHDSYLSNKDKDKDNNKDDKDRRASATVTDSKILENFAGRFGGGVFNGEPAEKNDKDYNENGRGYGSDHKDKDRYDSDHKDNDRYDYDDKDKDRYDDFAARLALRDSKVKENFAGKNGGGIYNNEGKVTLTDTKVKENKADNGDEHHKIAGGIFNNDGKVELDDDSTVTDNDPTNCAKTVEDCFN
ncbi:hypothetical protein [Micromonospora sp. CPCC 205556]|uniref:hypothetical protein n=1 Tax=Micromonospora sp. CPCC 205556 TaxID=3122398 RepID=UPI002FF1B7AD